VSEFIIVESGVTLRVKPGPVSGGPTPKVSIQWLRDGSPIEGATELTYVTKEDDIGTIITVSQSAVNSLGRAERSNANTNRFQITNSQQQPPGDLSDSIDGFGDGLGGD